MQRVKEINRFHFSIPEILILSAAAIIIFYQLMVPPIVGLADNGDFWRVMKWEGLEYQKENDRDNLFYYIHRSYSIKPETRWRFYVSSEIVLAQIGFLLNRLTTSRDLFDLRVIGFVHALSFLIALGVLLRASQGLAVPFRGWPSIILLLFFCDVAYIAYFNSFYAEPASLIFLFLMFGFALKIAVQQEPDIWSLILFFIAGVGFIAAKQQNSVLGFLLGIFMFRLSFLWKSNWLKRVAIALSLLFCISAFILFRSTPNFIKEAVLYNTVFYEILKKSPSPKEDLMEMGLPDEFSRFVGTHAFMPNVPVNDQEFRKRFFPHMGYWKIVKFYFVHPRRLFELLEVGAGQAFLMRFPGYLGNFEESAGFGPAGQSQAFTLWSDVKRLYFPRSIGTLGLFFGLYAIALLVIRARIRIFRYQYLCEVYLLLILMAITQFLISILAAGEQDLIKHLFLFNAITDILFAGMVIAFFRIMIRIMQEFYSRYVTK